MSDARRRAGPRGGALGVELGLRQCRLRQDPRADRPGGAAAARRHRAAEGPLPHLHQGGGRRDAEPAVQDARRLGDARRRRRCARRCGELGEPGDAIPADRLARARTLFARALETPGGLKIQTIHAFCEALLRRFPLEAGVAPQFGVLEDRQARALREEVLDDARRWRGPTRSPPSPASMAGDDPDAAAARDRPAPRRPSRRRSTPRRLAAALGARPERDGRGARRRGAAARRRGAAAPARRRSSPPRPGNDGEAAARPLRRRSPQRRPDDPPRAARSGAAVRRQRRRPRSPPRSAPSRPGRSAPPIRR